MRGRRQRRVQQRLALHLFAPPQLQPLGPARYGHTVTRSSHWVVAIMATAVVAISPRAAVASVWADWKVDRSVYIADHHWPSSSCFGHQRIDWMRGSELDALAPDRHLAGLALPDCRTVIAWDRVPATAAWLCTVLEHEFGHQSGLLDSADRNDVMFWRFWDTSPDCRAAFRRPRMWLRWGGRVSGE